MPTHPHKAACYRAIADFLAAYQTRNIDLLDSRYGIGAEVLEEIDESVSFAPDKTRLHICSLSEADRIISGQPYLYMDEIDGGYLVECALFLDNEHIGYIMGEFNRQPDGSHRFHFQYFSL